MRRKQGKAKRACRNCKADILPILLSESYLSGHPVVEYLQLLPRNEVTDSLRDAWYLRARPERVFRYRSKVLWEVRC